MKAIPQLFLYKQDKRTSLGAITTYTELTEDIRFNACSELSFTVPKKYYDIDNERWADNPVYNYIEKHKLLLFNDDTDYFEYPSYPIGDSDYYKYKNSSSFPYRYHLNLRLDQNLYLEHFQVQPETELFDIGGASGYLFEQCHLIAPDPSYNSPGSVIDYSPIYNTSSGGDYAKYLAVSSFIPVSSTDVIAFHTDTSDGITNPRFKWSVFAYESDNAGSYRKPTDYNTHNEYVNYRWWYQDRMQTQRLLVKDLLPQGGFVRFMIDLSSQNYYEYWYSNGSGYSRDKYPDKNCCKIFSGERRCTNIDNAPSNGTNKIKMRWFQIVSVDEEDDGVSCVKKVTAYSYEYTLQNTTFSLSEETLPLYIPDAITNLVNGSNWLIDYNYEYRGNNQQTVSHRDNQIMKSGVINEILSALPNWQVGHISSKLMTTYRKVDEVDDIDAYSYLMSTVQSVYNCFIVFDNDNMTISAYSLEDISDLKTDLYLSWDNSIKSFQKSNMDASYFTALKVKAGDETYGMGVVNPTGNSVIYDFNRIKPELNYYLDGATGNDRRMLSDAVDAWMAVYKQHISSGGYGRYKDASKEFISANMALIKAESAKKTALSEYLAVVDKIRVTAKANNSASNIYDAPMTLTTIDSSPDSMFVNKNFKDELYIAAQAYWSSDENYEAAKQSFNTYKNTLTEIAKSLTLNPVQAKALSNGDEYHHAQLDNYSTMIPTINVLSAAEIKELRKYIIEGTWNYESAAFSDTYNTDDIYDTLREVLDEARFDLSNRLAIANFDFKIDSANIRAIPEFETQCKSICMGHQVSLRVDDEHTISPLLLSMHINYKDPNDFEFTFTTDYKRRPEQFRFADLYSTITQTSATDKSFTFDT